MIAEHDSVMLTADLPGTSLAACDIDTVVHVYGDGRAFEVEFVALDGEAVAVATVTRQQIKPVAPKAIAHARSVA
jgi:hypothetical protein